MKYTHCDERPDATAPPCHAVTLIMTGYYDYDYFFRFVFPSVFVVYSTATLTVFSKLFDSACTLMRA